MPLRERGVDHMPKKKYSINWEDDFPSTYEVNGVQYETLEDVPDEGDRRKLQAMADASFTADIDAEIEAQKQAGIPAEKIIFWVFSGVAGSVPESLCRSTRCALNWSFAVRRSSVPITPMKSAPCPPNWSFARSQGSWLNGGGVRRGWTASSWLRWVRRWAVA